MKINPSVLILFILSLSWPAFGQSLDSLVSLKDLKFSSDFERQNFLEYFKDKDHSHIPDFLLATDPTMDESRAQKVKKEIIALVNSLRIEGVEKKKPAKKIKQIYDFIHLAILRKYELETRFYEVFSTGTYNCVTATALYALIFDALKIPYEIKEKPTHVYLLAYPNVENIIVETTTPLFGYLTFDATYKQNFINTLKSVKLIGQAELGQKSTDELFNQYYFRDQKIDLLELVGIHYMNDALFRNGHGDQLGSYRQIEKGYLFYRSSRSEFLLMNFGLQVVEKEKLSPKEKSILVAKLSRYRELGVTPDMIKGEFSNLTQEVLFRNNDKSLYRECYQLFLAGIQDKELSDDISYIYFYENGRAAYNQGNIFRSKPYFQKALNLQPNNVDLNRIFISVLTTTLHSKDNKMKLDSIKYYQTIYPSLKEYSALNSFAAIVCLAQFQEDFEIGHPEEGNKYRMEFEEIVKSNKDMTLDESQIGDAYDEAVKYYINKGQKTKAREVLMKGLSFAPGNFRLKQWEKSVGK